MKRHSWEGFAPPTRSCKTPVLSTTQADQPTEHRISHPVRSTQVFHCSIRTFLCFPFPLLVFRKEITQQSFSPLWQFPTGMHISARPLLVPALLALFSLSAQALLTWAWTHPKTKTPSWSPTPTTPTQLPAHAAAMRVSLVQLPPIRLPLLLEPPKAERYMRLLHW